MGTLGMHLDDATRAIIETEIRKGRPLNHIAMEFGASWSTVKRVANRMSQDAPSVKPETAIPPRQPTIIFPPKVSKELPINELLDLMEKRSAIRQEAQASKDWMPIKIDTIEPIVIAFVGDPHLDNDGTDWVQLRHDVELMKRPHVYAVNIGDSSDNWVGSLMRLYEHAETSSTTARTLVKWFMCDSGINWLMWIMGNHDSWNQGAEILNLMNPGHIIMEDWHAKFRIVFANGVEVPIWASHNFKGSSIWNKNHGLMRTAMMRGGARIYVAGHLHTWMLTHEEMPDTGDTYWAARVSGYKRIDSHATRNGFPSSTQGSTIGAVLDPRTGRETLFPDLAGAIRYRDALAAEYANPPLASGKPKIRVRAQ